MAHSNGRIYIDPNSTGVEIADLQQVLGRITGDLGQLCSDQEAYIDHYENEGSQDYDPEDESTWGNPVWALRPLNPGRINKWAKYKPVKVAGLAFHDQMNADFTWKDTATWWKAGGQCGLTFTTYNSLGANTIASAGFLHDLLAGSLSWGYEKPTGGIGSFPFRIWDFNYYEHTAPKPVAGVYDNLRLYGNGKLTVQLDEGRAAGGLGVQLSDLAINSSAVSGWYVGILIWKSNSQFTFAFSDDTIGNSADSVEFTGMTNFQGSVQIVPFLSSVRANQGNDPGSGVFVSCDVAPQSVTIAAEVVAIQMTIDAQWKDALHGRVKYVVNIINNTGSQVSVGNLVIALYDGSQNINTDTVGTIAIPAGAAREESGVFIVQAYDPTKTYSIVVSSSRTEVNGIVTVEPFRG